METKRSIGIFVCTGLLAGLLTGCGGEYAGRTEGDAVSGGAVSGNAVSGQPVSGGAVSDPVVSGPAVSEKEKTTDVEKDWLFRTDTNLYDANGRTIIQRRLDGSQKKKIKIPGCREFLGTVKDRLYYVKRNEDKKGDWFECVCALPIEKDADGFDVLRTGKPEEVTPIRETHGIDEYYLDSEYLIHTDGAAQTVIKYDIKTKRKLSETSWNQAVDCMRCGDYFVAYDGWNEELRYQKCEDTGGEWTLLAAEGDYDGFDEELAVSGKNLFFFEGRSESGEEEGIYKYDLEKGENTCFITDKELLAAAAEAVGQELNLEKGCCTVNNIWYERERVYVQAELCDTRDGIYYMQYLLFSKAPGESGLAYEREMTECMQSHGTVQKGKWLAAEHYKSKKKRVAIEHARVNDAQCYRIINGKAFFSVCDRGQEKRRVACYDLETGDFKWLTKKDREYYEPCYEPQNTLCYYGMSGEYGAADQDTEYTGFYYPPFLIPYEEEGWESASWFVEEK